MTSQKQSLTASGISYLLAINELEKDLGGVKSVEVAKLLDVKKPSAHTMIAKLCEKGYAAKEKYEAVRLTESGKQLAEKYSELYSFLYGKLDCSLGITPKGCRNAVCAILAQTSADETAEAKKQEISKCRKSY